MSFTTTTFPNYYGDYYPPQGSYDNCSASQFSAPSTTAVTQSQESMFETFTNFLQGLMSFDPDSEAFPDSDPITRFTTGSLLIYNIWGTLMLLYLVCAGIPLIVCVCCNCCQGPDRKY